MTCDPDALYAFLNSCGGAVDRASAGRTAEARVAWWRARAAAMRLAPADDCLLAGPTGIILGAASTNVSPDGRAELWNALDAAAAAVMAIIQRRGEAASVIWPDALAASDALAHRLQVAVLTLLAEAQDMAWVTP